MILLCPEVYRLKRPVNDVLYLSVALDDSATLYSV